MTVNIGKQDEGEADAGGDDIYNNSKVVTASRFHSHSFVGPDLRNSEAKVDFYIHFQFTQALCARPIQQNIRKKENY